MYFLIMPQENNNSVRVSQEDLASLSFLPIWIYHSICYSALSPQRVDKRAMIFALETHTDKEYTGVVGFMLGYLKFNLHKLFELHYKNLEQPDLGHFEADLVETIDLLQTSSIEQPGFLEYQQFLRELAVLFAEKPRIQGEITSEERKQLLAKALLVQRMLS